ncbi:uncharacterized protein LOC120263255 isoform X2 [Dioscorea cayenensis subsp. rotundata]|nr:uncharacterized protein LOC120263255 isoform X2 [Dioscorea cayenensis subsp. rotundata]
MDSMKSTKGSVQRIKQCANDLMVLMEEEIVVHKEEEEEEEEEEVKEEDGEICWDLMGRDLILKSTFLFCDLTNVLSNAPLHHKANLTLLANNFLFYIDELGQTVKKRSITGMKICHQDAALALNQLMDALMLLP